MQGNLAQYKGCWREWAAVLWVPTGGWFLWMDSCMKPEVSATVNRLLFITGSLPPGSGSTSYVLKTPDL